MDGALSVFADSLLSQTMSKVPVEKSDSPISYFKKEVPTKQKPPSSYNSQIERQKRDNEKELRNKEREITRLRESLRLSSEKIAILERNAAGFMSKFLEDFTVDGVIGEGGFGCVMEATNNFDDCRYAVKRIAVDLSKNQLDSALKEARALARLDHPGIIRYYGMWIEKPPEGWQLTADVDLSKKMSSSGNRLNMNYGRNSAFIYIQMQMCNYSLEWWLSEHTSAESRCLPRIKTWFKQMAAAVHYIHASNLIHRDLKPSNILFVDADTLKICDMGIATERTTAKGLETAITRTNMGTDLYMSPEQRVWRSKYGSKTDVFSLGLILAELCIVMTPSDRNEAEFVENLTRVDPDKRPSCADILAHHFFSSEIFYRL